MSGSTAERPDDGHEWIDGLLKELGAEMLAVIERDWTPEKCAQVRAQITGEPLPRKGNRMFRWLTTRRHWRRSERQLTRFLEQEQLRGKENELVLHALEAIGQPVAAEYVASYLGVQITPVKRTLRRLRDEHLVTTVCDHPDAVQRWMVAGYGEHLPGPDLVPPR